MLNISWLHFYLIESRRNFKDMGSGYLSSTINSLIFLKTVTPQSSFRDTPSLVGQVTLEMTMENLADG